MKNKPVSITILGRKWRDKINGNTYHSARVIADGELVAVAPFQYGYGDQWQWSAAAVFETAGKMPGREHNTNGSAETFWRWCERHGVKLVLDCADATKRECKSWGER